MTTKLIVELKTNGKHFILVEDFIFNLDYNNIKKDFIVYKGFTTDFSSIPKLLRVFFSNKALRNKASVVHDLFYMDTYKTGLSRKEKDYFFYLMLLQIGLNKYSSYAMYLAVRLFGNFVYMKKSKK
tara:strand:+ start:3960 stop:4337 length:378 start_codon:yes stop_codon:yes gene_type:complete